MTESGGVWTWISPERWAGRLSFSAVAVDAAGGRSEPAVTSGDVARIL